MAHNLATDSQGVNLIYQGDTPWHQLGTKVGTNCTIEEAIRLARLDYQVKTEPVFRLSGQKVDDAQLVVRTDTNVALKTVGPDYHVIQHTDIFRSLQPMANEFGLTVAAAGALGKGERLWMLLRLAQGDMTVVPGDDIRGYLLATTGHDGSWAYDANPTSIRPICQNTLDASLAESKDSTKLVKLYHTKGGAAKLDDAAKLLHAVVGEITKTGETFTQMAHRKMSPQELIKFVELLFPVAAAKPSDTIMARRKTVAQLVWTGVGSDVARSATNGEPNAWAAYNAVTEYFDHVRPAETKSASARASANVSAIWGQNANVKLNALKLARQLVMA